MINTKVDLKKAAAATKKHTGWGFNCIILQIFDGLRHSHVKMKPTAAAYPGFSKGGFPAVKGRQIKVPIF